MFRFGDYLRNGTMPQQSSTDYAGVGMTPTYAPTPTVSDIPMSDTSLWDGFDIVEEDAAAPAPIVPTVPQSAPQSPVQQPTGDDLIPYEQRRSHVQGDVTQAPTDSVDPILLEFSEGVTALVNSGASREEIEAYAATYADAGYSLPNLSEVLAYRDKNAGTQFRSDLNMAGGYIPEDLPEVSTGHAAAIGAADMLTVGAGDSIDAALDATANSVAQVFGGGNDLSWGQHYDKRKFANEQAIRAADKQHPIATNMGRLAGAVAVPTLGYARGAGALTNAARLGGEGAAYGAAYSYNSGNDMNQIVKDGGLGLAAGAILSPVARMGSAAAANRANGGGDGRAILEAADRLNANARTGDIPIKPLAGHTSNGGLGSALHALQEPSLIGGNLSGLQKAANQFREGSGQALERVADDVAGGASRPLPEVARDLNNPNLTGSLVNFERGFKGAAGRAYDDAERLANGATVSTPQTIRALDEIIMEWRKSPVEIQGLRELEELREALATGARGNGRHDVAGLRLLRTQWGRNLDSGSGDLRRIAGQIWPTLSRDITHGLNAAGNREAASAYRAADRAYAQNMDSLEVVKKIIGDGSASAAQVSSRLSKLSRDEATSIDRVLRAMPRDMADEVRGGVIRSLGTKSAGQAESADEFSLGTFLTNWNKLDGEAKDVLFTTGVRRDLEDLARLAGADRAVNKLGNPSRSGVLINNTVEAGAILAQLGLGGGVPIGQILGRWGGGRLLASPHFARALVKGSDAQSTEVLAKGLARAARATPAIAQSITGFGRDIGIEIDIPKEGDATVAAADAWDGFEVVDETSLGAPAAAPQTGGMEFTNEGLVRDANGNTFDPQTGAQVDLQ